MNRPVFDSVADARALLRRLDRATVAVRHPQAGPDGAAWPYASLVLVATDHDLSPLLFVSTLAEHTKAMDRDPAVSLLFDGTAGLDSPLTGARASVIGRAKRSDDPRLKQRFVARHPDAAIYASFPDFGLFRVEIERAHLVSGFGKIAWIEKDDLTVEPAAALVEREADIVGHMNDDHADAVQLYASKLLGRSGRGWKMTGIDANGCDLRLAGSVARLDFPAPVADADEARKTLVALVKQARAAA